MYKLRILIFAIIAPMMLFAQTNEALFGEANEAYIAKEYKLAIEKYEQVLESGVHAADVLYNLGNAYYRDGQLGKAILNYERGLLLDNTDNDLRYNLELAKKERIDEIEVLPPFFLSRWWRGVRELATSKGWAIIALITFWLGIAGLIIWQMASVRKQKKIGFVTGILLLLFSVFPFSLSINSASLEADSRRAVILSEEVELKNGPDDESTSILVLHQGTSLELLDQIGDWYKVKLLNGEQGWLKIDVFEKI